MEPSPSPPSPSSSFPLSAVLRPTLYSLFFRRGKKRRQNQKFSPPTMSGKPCGAFPRKRKKEKCSREKNFSFALSAFGSFLGVSITHNGTSSSSRDIFFDCLSLLPFSQGDSSRNVELSPTKCQGICSSPALPYIFLKMY